MPKPDSPEKYIRTRARSLPIGECYINSDWQHSGMAVIIVTRKHVTGNLTFGVFQVDLYCLGIKDAFWQFNEPVESVQSIRDSYEDFLGGDEGFILVDYPLVHNIIYGAEAYADDLGFRPHKDFALTKYILEEDDQRIDLIEIDFGLKGKPAVVIGRESHPGNIFSVLDRSVGKGNYTIISDEESYPDDEEDTRRS